MSDDLNITDADRRFVERITTGLLVVCCVAVIALVILVPM